MPPRNKIETLLSPTSEAINRKLANKDNGKSTPELIVQIEEERGIEPKSETTIQTAPAIKQVLIDRTLRHHFID